MSWSLSPSKQQQEASLVFNTSFNEYYKKYAQQVAEAYKNPIPQPVWYSYTISALLKCRCGRALMFARDSDNCVCKYSKKPPEECAASAATGGPATMQDLVSSILSDYGMMETQAYEYMKKSIPQGYNKVVYPHVKIVPTYKPMKVYPYTDAIQAPDLS